MSIMDISPSGANYSFNGCEVRVVSQNGEPWFVAADVCRILELSNPTRALSSLEDDERMTLTDSKGHSGQKGGAQSFNVISESGLYALVLKSRKPTAKAFRKWITSEVIPSIRKTGTYVAQPIPAVPTTLKDALKLALATMEERDILAAQVTEQKPMVAYYHKCAASDSTLSLNDAAKVLGLGRNKLMVAMRADGILTAANLPYQRHMDSGLFRVAMKPIDRTTGQPMVVKMCRVTPRGIEFLRRKYATGQLKLLA